MSPAATNAPPVNPASPNGSVGLTSRVLLSAPLTTASRVGPPGPVTRIVSGTPSPSMSAVVLRTGPVKPLNGASGLPWAVSFPVASRAKSCAAPFACPDTATRSCPGPSPPRPGAAKSSVTRPKTPCDSSSGPAAKYRVMVLPAVVPFPNVIPHSPSITTGLPDGSVRNPLSVPSVGSNALIRPSPKLPTSRSPPTSPANRSAPRFPNRLGAMARPHGAFSRPPVAIRRRKFPLVSNTSTTPSPGPCTSSSPVVGRIA